MPKGTKKVKAADEPEVFVTGGSLVQVIEAPEEARGGEILEVMVAQAVEKAMTEWELQAINKLNLIKVITQRLPEMYDRYVVWMNKNDMAQGRWKPDFQHFITWLKEYYG